MDSPSVFFSKDEFARHVSGAFSRILAKNSAIPAHLPQICPAWLGKVRFTALHDPVAAAITRIFETRPSSCLTGIVFDLSELPARSEFLRIFHTAHHRALSPEDEYSAFRANVGFALSGRSASSENSPGRRSDGTFGRRKFAWGVLPTPFGGAAYMIRKGGEKVFVASNKARYLRHRNLALALRDESLALNINPVGGSDSYQTHPLSDYLDSPSDDTLATLLRNIGTQPVAFPSGALAFRPPSLERAAHLRETRIPLNLSGPWPDEDVRCVFASGDTATASWLSGLPGISDEARSAVQLSSTF